MTNGRIVVKGKQEFLRRKGKLLRINVRGEPGKIRFSSTGRGTTSTRFRGDEPIERIEGAPTWLMDLWQDAMQRFPGKKLKLSADKKAVVPVVDIIPAQLATSGQMLKTGDIKKMGFLSRLRQTAGLATRGLAAITFRPLGAFNILRSEGLMALKQFRAAGVVQERGILEKEVPAQLDLSGLRLQREQILAQEKARQADITQRMKEQKDLLTEGFFEQFGIGVSSEERMIREQQQQMAFFQEQNRIAQEIAMLKEFGQVPMDLTLPQFPSTVPSTPLGGITDFLTGKSNTMKSNLLLPAVIVGGAIFLGLSYKKPRGRK